MSHPLLLEFGLLWAGALASLGAALVLMSFYFRILGSDLALNSVPKELVLALVVSAIQAGCVWFVLPFAHGAPRASLNGNMIFVIPGLVSLLLYKLAHVADWDQYESPGLTMFQFVLVFAAASCLTGGIGLGVFILTAFATVLLIVCGIVKKA